MGDSASAGLRERIWIDVLDHEHDPPRLVRQVFIEDGVIQSDTSVVTTAPASRPADESAPPPAP